MNAPVPVAPASTPASVIAAGAPSFGSLVGSILGMLAAAKLGFGPADAGAGSLIVASVTTLVTGAFHWLGLKLKTTVLG